MCFAAKRCAAGVGDAEAGLCLLWEGWAPAGYVQKSVGPSALRRSRRESRLIDWDQHYPLPPSLAPPLQPTPPPSSPPLLHLLLLLLVCSCTGSTFACLHHPFLPPHPPPAAAAIPSSLFLHTQTCFITHTPFSPAERVQQRGGKTRYFNKKKKKKRTPGWMVTVTLALLMRTMGREHVSAHGGTQTFGLIQGSASRGSAQFSLVREWSLRPTAVHLGVKQISLHE